MELLEGRCIVVDSAGCMRFARTTECTLTGIGIHHVARVEWLSTSGAISFVSLSFFSRNLWLELFFFLSGLGPDICLCPVTQINGFFQCQGAQWMGKSDSYTALTR